MAGQSPDVESGCYEPAPSRPAEALQESAPSGNTAERNGDTSSSVAAPVLAHPLAVRGAATAGCSSTQQHLDHDHYRAISGGPDQPQAHAAGGSEATVSSGCTPGTHAAPGVSCSASKEPGHSFTRSGETCDCRMLASEAESAASAEQPSNYSPTVVVLCVTPTPSAALTEATQA